MHIALAFNKPFYSCVLPDASVSYSIDDYSMLLVHCIIMQSLNGIPSPEQVGWVMQGHSNKNSLCEHGRDKLGIWLVFLVTEFGFQHVSQGVQMDRLEADLHTHTHTLSKRLRFSLGGLCKADLLEQHNLKQPLSCHSDVKTLEWKIWSLHLI